MPEDEESHYKRITQAEAAQPSLWPDPDALAAGAGDRYQVGQFTGERLAEHDPERYRAIVRALANGMGIRSIARAYRVSPNTVAAVRAREGASIETLKQELAGMAHLGATMAIDRIIDEIDQFKRESLPIVAGVLIDKAQLLTGQATSIVQRQDGPAGWEDALASIRQATGKTIDAAGTGLDPDDDATKGAQPALPEPGTSAPAWPVIPAAETPDYSMARDSQSPAFPSNHGHSSAAGNEQGHAGHGHHDQADAAAGSGSSRRADRGGGSGARGAQESIDESGR